MTRLGIVAIVALAGAAQAQSLYLVDSAPEQRTIEPGSQFLGWSMIAAPPPEPRVFEKHDLITIIIDENTLQSAEQTLETEKKTSGDAGVNAFVDVQSLLELQLQQGDINGLELYDIVSNAKFDADGEFERKDKFQGRITAEVLDVKPNGTLVLEAKTSIDKDGEVITIIASGICRSEDITEQNTVLSTQLANKMLVTRHAGQVRKGARKGWITRTLDTIFAF